MKKWIAAAVLAAALLWSPARGIDVGKLIPVELVEIGRQEQLWTVRTDTGHAGQGQSLSEAFRDLKAKAPGEIYLETAEYALLTEAAVPCLGELPAYFRPGTQVYRTEPLEDLSAAAAFLTVHSPQAPLFRLLQGQMAMPQLRREGESLIFAEEQT